MRLRHPDGTTVHLGYCSNVHAAEDLDGVCAQLGTYAAPVRRRLGWDRLGVGLWLAADVAVQLDEDAAARERLRGAVAAAGCEVVTLNGFPYAGFHDGVVKHRVYRPDWREPDRRAHTLRLARILCELLPDDVGAGTISTLPLGWGAELDDDGTAAAVRELAATGEDLAALEARTGRRIALAVEPEPGCRVETAAQLAEVLGPVASPTLGACADLCHMAVLFEQPDAAVAGLEAAGVAIPKAQVSAGLRLPAPASAGRDRAAPHASSPFLHQVRERGADGSVAGTDDLPEALAGALPGEGEWRIHAHTPVHLGGDGTTQDVTAAGLAALVGGPRCRTPHLEVETYTWPTLPGADAAADPTARLVEGIADELAWTLDQLTGLGLQPLG